MNKTTVVHIYLVEGCMGIYVDGELILEGNNLGTLDLLDVINQQPFTVYLHNEFDTKVDTMVQKNAGFPGLEKDLFA